RGRRGSFLRGNGENGEVMRLLWPRFDSPSDEPAFTASQAVRGQPAFLRGCPRGGAGASGGVVDTRGRRRRVGIGRRRRVRLPRPAWWPGGGGIPPAPSGPGPGHGRRCRGGGWRR